MLEQWEEFTAGPSKPHHERLHVSLNHKGQFLLNKKMLDAMGNPGAVTLFFSKHSSKVGIRAADKVAEVNLLGAGDAVAHRVHVLVELH